MRYRQVSRECNIDFSRRPWQYYHKKWLLTKNGKTIDFFLKSVLRKTAEFSVSDTGDPLILTCLAVIIITFKYLSNTFGYLLRKFVQHKKQISD